MKGFLMFLVSKAGKLILTIVLAIIIWFVGITLLMSNGSDSNVPIIIFFLVCGFFGLGFIDTYLSSFSVAVPIEAAIVIWTLKIGLAIIIGVFVAPIQISRYIVNFIEEAINHGE